MLYFISSLTPPMGRYSWRGVYSSFVVPGASWELNNASVGHFLFPLLYLQFIAPADYLWGSRAVFRNGSCDMLVCLLLVGPCASLDVKSLRHVLIKGPGSLWITLRHSLMFETRRDLNLGNYWEKLLNTNYTNTSQVVQVDISRNFNALIESSTQP